MLPTDSGQLTPNQGWAVFKYMYLIYKFEIQNAILYLNTFEKNKCSLYLNKFNLFVFSKYIKYFCPSICLLEAGFLY